MNNRTYFITILCGFLGGFFLTALVACSRAYSSPAYNGVMLVGSNNKMKVWLGNASGGGSGIWFLNQSGRTRLSASIFPNGQHAYLNLTSRTSDVNPKIMFRTDGKNRNPMLFIKNKKDQHRIDLGADINHPDENPYLVYFDKSGKKTNVFGSFPYIENAGQ